MRTLYETFTDEDKAKYRVWLTDMLKAGSVYVTFEKKDGTKREMRCTLKEDRVLSYDKKTERTKNVSDEVCPVFDLDKQEWRSFRYDSITEVRIEIEST